MNFCDNPKKRYSQEQVIILALRTCPGIACDPVFVGGHSDRTRVRSLEAKLDFVGFKRLLDPQKSGVVHVK